jgi:hypothetical protein
VAVRRCGRKPPCPARSRRSGPISTGCGRDRCAERRSAAPPGLSATDCRRLAPVIALLLQQLAHRLPGRRGSLRNSRWISTRNGSSFDGRGGRRQRGASAERSARRIVLRPWPVRRTISLIDNRFTKYKRRISAHCSTPTTTSSSLEPHRARHPTTPDSATTRRQGVSFQPASRGQY